MDPLTSLYQRLRQSGQDEYGHDPSGYSRANVPTELPEVEAWLTFWNDADTDLGNLRNFEHWLSVGRASPMN